MLLQLPKLLRQGSLGKSLRSPTDVEQEGHGDLRCL